MEPQSRPTKRPSLCMLTELQKVYIGERRRQERTSSPGFELNRSSVSSWKDLSGKSKSNSRTKVEMTSSCSKYAMFLPMQARGPVLKGKWALAIFSLSPVIHRSGLYAAELSNAS